MGVCVRVGFNLVAEFERGDWEGTLSSCGGDPVGAARRCGLTGVLAGPKASWGWHPGGVQVALGGRVRSLTGLVKRRLADVAAARFARGLRLSSPARGRWARARCCAGTRIGREDLRGLRLLKDRIGSIWIIPLSQPWALGCLIFGRLCGDHAARRRAGGRRRAARSAAACRADVVPGDKPAAHQTHLGDGPGHGSGLAVLGGGIADAGKRPRADNRRQEGRRQCVGGRGPGQSVTAKRLAPGCVPGDVLRGRGDLC
jgi:hypothetical protein